MTATILDAPRETTMSLMHRSCNNGVIQLSPINSYAVLEFVEIIHACFVQEDAKDASVSECTWTLSALEALHYALYKFKTYLLTYLLIPHVL